MHVSGQRESIINKRSIIHQTRHDQSEVCHVDHNLKQGFSFASLINRVRLIN